MNFKPRLDILPPSQKALWGELHDTPEHFTLYGGTALALHLGHRKSVDFDFFSREPFEAEDLMRSIPYLEEAERLDVSKNNFTCSVNRRGKIKLQFFGGLSLGRVKPRHHTSDGVWIASLLDIAGTTIKVLPERSQAKDYIDIAALLKHGVDLPIMLGAANAIYGRTFNPVPSVKALSYFADVPRLPEDVKERLRDAAIGVDLGKLPVIKPAQPALAKGKNS